VKARKSGMHNFKLKGAPGSKSGDQLYREFKQFEQDILIEDRRAAEFQKKMILIILGLCIGLFIATLTMFL